MIRKSTILSTVVAVFLVGCTTKSIPNKNIDYEKATSKIDSSNLYKKSSKDLTRKQYRRYITIYKGENLSSILQKLSNIERKVYILDKRSLDLSVEGASSYNIYSFKHLQRYISGIYPEYSLVISKKGSRFKPYIVSLVESERLTDLDLIYFNSKYMTDREILFNKISELLAKKGWIFIDKTGLTTGKDRINFHGSIRKFLKYYAETHNIFVDFDYTNRQVKLSYYKVKSFPIYLDSNKYSIDSSVQMSSSGDRGNSGSNFKSSDNQEELKSFKESMKKLFDKGSGKDGSDSWWMLLENSNRLVVKADPEKMKIVEDLVDNSNKKALSQLNIKITLIEVNLNDKHQIGVDWNLIYRKGRDIITAAAPYSPTISASYDIAADRIETSRPAIFKFIRRDREGLSTLINLLNSFGKTSVFYQMPVVTKNNTPVIYNVSNKKAYIKSFTIVNSGTDANSINTNIQIQQENAISGRYVYIKPTILNDDSIILDLKMLFSNVNSIKKQVFSNGMFIQTPDIDENMFNQNIRIRSGDRIVIGGIVSRKDQGEFEGLTETANPLTGSSIKNYSNKEFVIVVEAERI